MIPSAPRPAISSLSRCHLSGRVADLSASFLRHLPALPSSISSSLYHESVPKLMPTAVAPCMSVILSSHQ